MMCLQNRSNILGKYGENWRKRVGNRAEVKCMIFIPHTRDSKLAQILRDRERNLEEITGEQVKEIEHAGRKMKDIL